jgi:transcriptional regulator with XRE-family HTH domain
LSQERLAEMTGVSTNFVGEMERGLKAPGLGVIVRLSLALGLGARLAAGLHRCQSAASAALGLALLEAITRKRDNCLRAHLTPHR